MGVRERLGEQRIDGAIEKGARRRVEPALVRRLTTKREKKGGGPRLRLQKRHLRLGKNQNAGANVRDGEDCAVAWGAGMMVNAGECGSIRQSV